MMGSLDAPLGLAGVSAEGIDVQLEHRPGELRVAIATLSIFAVDSEHTGLAAVERQGLAVLLQVGPGSLEVADW